MTDNELAAIVARHEKATPGPWGPYTANIPFYAEVTKPAPSYSKHDSERPTYWRIEDAQFVAAAHEDIGILLDYIRLLKAQLWVAKDAQLRTYDGLVQENERLEAQVARGQQVFAELQAEKDLLECEVGQLRDALTHIKAHADCRMWPEEAISEMARKALYNVTAPTKLDGDS